MSGSALANLSVAHAGRGLADLESGLLNALGEAVIATDLDGYVIYWNRAAESLYGWTADEVIGRNILDVTPSAESRAAAAVIFDRLTKGESWSGKFKTRHKDGRCLLVHVTDYPVRDTQGKLTAIVGISKAVEEAVKMPSEPAGDAAARLLNRSWMKVRSVFGSLTNRAELPRLLRGFAIAVLLYGFALGARVLLDQIVPERLPFISFFPAILMAAFVCGFWPTLALLLASAVTGALWGAPSDGDLLEFQFLAAALFIMIGGMVIAPAIYVTNIQRHLKLKEEQLSLVNRELKHRIKNLFAVTSSICLQTIKSDLPREALAAAIAGRIQAAASAQDLVDVTAEKGADLRALVEAVVRPLSPEASRLEMNGPSVFLPIEATMPFALILHELATNAVKHGAWASTQGRTVIQWRLPTERQLELRWREENVSPPTPPQREGFGSVVIKRALTQAKVRHEIGPQGADCLIELPI